MGPYLELYLIISQKLSLCAFIAILFIKSASQNTLKNIHKLEICPLISKNKNTPSHKFLSKYTPRHFNKLEHSVKYM